MSTYPYHKTEEEWKAKLSEEQYHILRQKGTERPFTGAYNIHSEGGTYTCMACDVPLFKSTTKFDAGCGWPSFDESIEGNVEYVRDKTLGMIRTEILCANCGSHLGHVFDDGPTESKQRYCVNSISINFDKS